MLTKEQLEDAAKCRLELLKLNESFRWINNRRKMAGLPMIRRMRGTGGHEG